MVWDSRRHVIYSANNLLTIANQLTIVPYTKLLANGNGYYLEDSALPRRQSLSPFDDEADQLHLPRPDDGSHFR